MSLNEVIKHTEGWRWTKAQWAPVYNLVFAVISGLFLGENWGTPIQFLWLALLVILSHATINSTIRLVILLSFKAEQETINKGG